MAEFGVLQFPQTPQSLKKSWSFYGSHNPTLSVTPDMSPESKGYLVYTAPIVE